MLHLICLVEDFHSWKFFPLEELERCPTSCRDVAHFFLEASLAYRSRRVAATDDGNGSLCGCFGHCFRDRASAGVEGPRFKHTHRAVPDDSLCGRDCTRER